MKYISWDRRRSVQGPSTSQSWPSTIAGCTWVPSIDGTESYKLFFSSSSLSFLELIDLFYSWLWPLLQSTVIEAYLAACCVMNVFLICLSISPNRSCREDATLWSHWSRERTWSWRKRRRPRERRKGRQLPREWRGKGMQLQLNRAEERRRRHKALCMLMKWPISIVK